MQQEIKNRRRKNIQKTHTQTLHQASTLHKVFKKNAIQILYSCTENMRQLIRSHNRKRMKKKLLVQIKPMCKLQNK